MQFFLFRTTALEEKNADYIIDNQRFMKVIPPRFERGTHALEGQLKNVTYYSYNQLVIFYSLNYLKHNLLYI